MNWEKQHESTGGRLVIDWDYLTAKFHREERDEGPLQEVARQSLLRLDRPEPVGRT